MQVISQAAVTTTAAHILTSNCMSWQPKGNNKARINELSEQLHNFREIFINDLRAGYVECCENFVLFSAMKLTVNLILEYNQKENMTFLCRLGNLGLC